MQELTRLPHELAVGVDLAIRAEVADHVPMQARLVAAAELLEAGPEREVHRAADLLVEQDVAREAVDLIVETEGGLTEDAGALVHVEERLQIVVPDPRLGLDDASVGEAQANVIPATPLEDRRERETDLAFGPGLDRAREDLAVR